MKKFLPPLLLCCMHMAMLAQQPYIIQGKVTDYLTNSILAGATVTLKEQHLTVMTDDQGVFKLGPLKPGNGILTVSYIGYETTDIILKVDNNSNSIKQNITLHPLVSTGEVIVVTASKHAEKITQAPASIQVITIKDIDQFAGSNTTELLSKIQGIEYTRNGVSDINFNARGLNSAFNNKVMQLVDGRNSMSALSAGLPVMNRGTTIKDDIERIEVVLGPQSALYGPNAHNAVYNTLTKDPRKYQGTTVSMSAGSQQQWSTRLRHAMKINQHWAYKITGEYAIGKEFEFYDSVYAGGGIWGDPVTIPERNVNFNFRYIRGEANIYYTINPTTTVIFSAGTSNNTWPQVTTAGRNQMRGVTYSFIQARLIHPRYYFNVYNTWGTLGSSYSIPGYTRDYWNRTHSLDTAHRPGNEMTRRLSPDSAELFAMRPFKERNQRLNAEFQYNYFFRKIRLLLVAGLNYQLESPNGYGSTLVDSFTSIRIMQYGAVLQLEKNLPWRLRAIGAVRVDYHNNFGSYTSPKLTLTKAIGQGVIRFSWGQAIVMPSIQQQYAGIGRLLYGNGGQGIFYIPNGIQLYDTSKFKTTVPLVPEQISTWEWGYKATIAKKIFVDINFYNGVSKNFISPSRSVPGRALQVNGIPVYPINAGQIGSNDTLKGAAFATFFNYGNVKVYGVDAGITYQFNRFLDVSVKYSWFGSDIADNKLKNDANNDNFVSLEETSLNAPNNRAMVVINVQHLLKDKFMFSVTARWVEQYDFYSASQIGTEAGKGARGQVYAGMDTITLKPKYISKNFNWGPLGGFTSVDLTAGYQLNRLIRLNMGITNLFNSRQIEFVGSPSIQRLIMFEARIYIPNAKKIIELSKKF